VSYTDLPASNLVAVRLAKKSLPSSWFIGKGTFNCRSDWRNGCCLTFSHNTDEFRSIHSKYSLA